MEEVLDAQSPPEIVENVIETVLEESDEGSQIKPETEENVVDGEELEIEDSVWLSGKVSDWKHTWGFIVPLERNEENKGERIFVHASKISFADGKIPFLRKGMQVRFHSAVRVADKTKKVAVDVSALDGSPINWFEKHGDTDPYSRRSLGETTYKGKVKKYFYRKSYGWIEPEEPIDLMGFDNNRHIFVTREDVVCQEFPPGLKVHQEVEFTIYKDDRGFGAANVTGRGGVKLESPYGNEKDFEGKIFTGTVVKFRVNRFIFIRPDESLSEYGFFGKEDLHANCEDINTEQRPARVTENSKITFKLFKDKNGFHAVDINDENGSPILVENFEEERQKVRQEHEGEYEGTVKFFRWDNGSGWIHPEEESNIPEEIQDRIDKNKDGLVYFHRSDMMSEDKVFGMFVDTKIKFKLYTDDKGVGAFNITDENGESIKGVIRPREKRTSKKGTGVIGYYDRKKRLCHIRYRGRMFVVNDRNCRFAPEVKPLLQRGQKVEFIVEHHKGRKFLKNVTLCGHLWHLGSMQGPRRSQKRRDRQYGLPMAMEWQHYQHMLASMMYGYQQHPQNQMYQNGFNPMFNFSQNPYR